MQAALSWLHLYTAADVKRLNIWLFACLTTEHMNMFLKHAPVTIKEHETLRNTCR